MTDRQRSRSPRARTMLAAVLAVAGVALVGQRAWDVEFAQGAGGPAMAPPWTQPRDLLVSVAVAVALGVVGAGVTHVRE